ncbi:MAG: conjugal transfer protein [Chlorobi bacterium]|nr:conjugal transfer protein [Chlorobiota bacterium]
MKRTVKSLLLASLLFTVTPALPLIQSDAQAALTVIDISNLKQTTLTAVRSAEQIKNQIEQIRNQVRSLQTLPAAAFGPVKSIYDSNMQELNGLLSDVQGISFDLNRIDGQFDQLFPQGTWDQIDFNRYEQYYRDWTKELSEASKIAMKAQSVVERSQAFNNEAASILSRSAAADGEVRQLQSTNQMLGIMAGQLDGLTLTLAVSARVSAMAAAQAANREEAERAFSTQMWSGYGNVDKQANAKYTNMPNLKQ